jgi:hypothetical protein
MSDSPQDFDLKFLPDWLKEAPAPNRYADYEGESDRPRRDRDDRGPRPPGSRPPDRRGPQPDRRGPRPPQGDRPRGPRPDRPPGNRPPGGPRRDDRPGGNRPPQRRDDQRRDADRSPREAPRPAPAPLRIEFLPEPNAAAGIARQIRTTARAYAVFHTAKLFLERPERHNVRITSGNAGMPLFQVGDGPVTFDRASVERGAFLHAKDEYYTEETVQGEPIKGNFSNVARVRSTGTLLGPTNHHGYQPALRKLYEERFSRRMSFQEYQQQEVQIVSDEQTVADWKEQARHSTTYTTTKEAEPIVFKTLFDAEQHFRKTYLAQIVKSGTTLECSGPASRAGLDRHVSDAVREAWEKERIFPQGLVNALRPYFAEAGLQFFKHRKRVLHVTAVKPVRHPEGQPFSDGITAILKTVEAQPRIKRPQLAAKILGAGHDTPEAAPRKEQLAADLHYLIHIGYVIEFAEGSFDLPLSPRAEIAPAKGGAAATPEGEETEAAEEPAAEAEPITEAAPPLDEAPVPGEEEGEADPAEAAALLPIAPDADSSIAAAPAAAPQVESAAPLPPPGEPAP